MSKDNTRAVLTATNPAKVPTVSAGKLDIELIIEWEHACKEYFLIKVVKDDLMVSHAATGLQGLLVKSWFRNDADRLRALDWPSFVKKFKTRWLPAKWESDTRSALINCRQKHTDPFKTWVLRPETLNVCLAGTPSHKKDDAPRELVEANLCSRLQELAKEAETDTIVFYKAWRDKLITLDNARMAMANEILRMTTRVSTNNPSPRGSRPPRDPSKGPNSLRYPPPLTDGEKDLLSKYKGCFKCRRFFAGHMRTDCPYEAPKADGYKTLTAADADRAKRKHERGKKNKVPKTMTASARIVEEEED